MILKDSKTVVTWYWNILENYVGNVICQWCLSIKLVSAYFGFPTKNHIIFWKKCWKLVVYTWVISQRCILTDIIQKTRLFWFEINLLISPSLIFITIKNTRPPPPHPPTTPHPPRTNFFKHYNLKKTNDNNLKLPQHDHGGVFR